MSSRTLLEDSIIQWPTKLVRRVSRMMYVSVCLIMTPVCDSPCVHTHSSDDSINTCFPLAYAYTQNTSFDDRIGVLGEAVIRKGRGHVLHEGLLVVVESRVSTCHSDAVGAHICRISWHVVST